MPDKAAAIDELTNLINRSLHYVQFLRADAVDEVTRAFQVAVQCLENNLVGDGYVGRSEMINSTTDKLKCMAVEMERSDETPVKSAKKVNKPIPRTRIKVAMTRDFDSPGAKTRRLTAAAAAKKSVGGGGLSHKRMEHRDPEPKAVNKTLAKLGGDGPPVGRTYTQDTSSPSLSTRKLGGGAARNQNNQGSEFGGGLGGKGGGLAGKGGGLGGKDDFVGQKFGNQQQDRWIPTDDYDHSENIENKSPNERLMDLAHVTDEPRQHTPKAAFIRSIQPQGDKQRNVNQAKENLTKMLKSALNKAPQMKMSEYMEIKAKFENALNVLKAGCDGRHQQNYTNNYN